MKSYVILLPAEMDRLLRAYSAEFGQPLQVALRQALTAVIDHFKDGPAVPADLVLKRRPRDPSEKDVFESADPARVAAAQARQWSMRQRQGKRTKLKPLRINLEIPTEKELARIAARDDRSETWIIRTTAVALAKYADAHGSLHGPFQVAEQGAVQAVSEGPALEVANGGIVRTLPAVPKRSVPRNDAVLRLRLPAAQRDAFYKACLDTNVDASATVRYLLVAAVEFARERKHLSPPFRLELSQPKAPTPRPVAQKTA
jgi:hypothetical protein